MLVKDVMNSDVKTINKGKSVQEAASLMGKFGIGSLVVVKDSQMVGIITERDILTKVVAEDRNSSKIKISDIMTKEVVMVNPDTSVEDAADVMTEKKIKKLPVVDKNQLVGIITASDICMVEPKLIEQLSSLMLVSSGKKKFVAG